MDLVDIKDRSAFIPKEEWGFCWVNSKIDVTGLEGVVSVKRG